MGGEGEGMLALPTIPSALEAKAISWPSEESRRDLTNNTTHIGRTQPTPSPYGIVHNDHR
jgi:hypothetical protein